MLNKFAGIARAARYLGQSMRLMVGVPEYSTYVTHMRNRHPDQSVMSYQEFFRERQEARYGGKVSRCC
ncbi:MAG: YbdD/YjiX family protein [Pseudomonadota bacterium]|nr:YbdD/YjiX family protein [Pseudomonadota bacterium]